MAYVVAAKWTAREGEEGEVRQAILDLIEPSRAEPANLFYQPSQDPDNPRVFLLFKRSTRTRPATGPRGVGALSTAGGAGRDPPPREPRAGVLRDLGRLA